MQTATLPTFAPQPRSLSPEDVADSMSALAETYSRPDAAGVCVADGFGVRVVVERGALEVYDGIGPHRRTRRFDRATHGLRRLVILNAAGIVSLDALRWCDALGVGVLVLGSDGTAQLASTPRMTDDARLRRTQALAPFEPYGLEVARWLMSRKIMGQGKLVLRHFDDSDDGRDDRRSCPRHRGGRAQSTSYASSKRAPPPSTSEPGQAAPSASRASRPRTGAASRRTGHATKDAARCSPRPPRTARPSDR